MERADGPETVHKVGAGELGGRESLEPASVPQGYPNPPVVNPLYYGDNLRMLREHIADESVDLIYLDPPFNSNATYNVLFKAPDGHQSQAQIEAFDDTWHWTDSAEDAYWQV